MDRLEFIVHALSVIASEPLEPLAEYMVATAIRREIETVRQRPAQNLAAIETYMIQTRAISV